MRLIDADALKEMKFSGGMHDDNWIVYVPFREVVENIDKAPIVGDWISVKDRPPEEDGLYNVYCKDGSMAHAWFEDKWFIDHCECGDGYVTHWMPLPEPPMEDEI